MRGYTIKRIDDMEAVFGGAFKRARAELGAQAFGLQVLDIAPNETRYPEHDHAHDGQEEVFITISGSGEIEIEGERHPFDPDTMVRVGPGLNRKIWPGDEGMRVIAIGGVPGRAYEPSDLSKLGSPDPMKQRSSA
jgi:mannose-6-phosphate isomerase-like protein (cupin superfamily)